MKRKFIFISISIIAFVVILGGALFLNYNNSTDKTRVLTVNYAGSYSNSMMLIMKDQHMIEKYLPKNTTVKWTNIASSTEMRDGVVSGNIDIAGLSIPSYLSAVENNIPLDIISYAGNTPIKMYSNRSDINSLKDIKSSDRISLVGLNTILHVAFLIDAYNEFGSVDQFNNSFVVLPHADGLTALVTGSQVDAYITTFPTTIKADNTKEIKEIHDFTDTVISYGVGSVNIISDEFYKENKDLVDAFLKAQSDAVKFSVDNRTETIKIMATDWKVDNNEIEKVLESMPLTRKINGYNTLADFLYKIKFLKKKPTSFENLTNYKELKSL